MIPQHFSGALVLPLKLSVGLKKKTSKKIQTCFIDHKRQMLWFFLSRKLVWFKFLLNSPLVFIYGEIIKDTTHTSFRGKKSDTKICGDFFLECVQKSDSSIFTKIVEAHHQHVRFIQFYLFTKKNCIATCD